MDVTAWPVLKGRREGNEYNHKNIFIKIFEEPGVLFLIKTELKCPFWGSAFAKNN
jgi:hypothetical protein